MDHNAYERTKPVCKIIVNCADIIIPKPRIASIQRYKNNVPANNALDYYKRAVWYPFIDCIVSELKSCFSNHPKLAMHTVALLPPICVAVNDRSRSENFVNFDSIAKFFAIYGSFLESGISVLESEFFRRQLKWPKSAPSERLSTVAEALQSCDSSMCENIKILLQIFVTLPMSSATAERSFSALRLLKTYLRSTMREERLNGLALMFIHKTIPLSYESIIEKYVKLHNHKLKFV